MLRVEQVAAERQRLWLRLARHWDAGAAERAIELTRFLNGHASDIRRLEPERHYRVNGQYADRRTAVVEREAPK